MHGSTLQRWASIARVCVVSTCALVSLSVTAGGESSHQTSGLSISVENARPLGAAVRELGHRHGWVLTYEDPRFDYPGDQLDVTFSVARSPVPPGRRILIPRGGPFTFTYGPAENGALDARTTLDALVKAYSARGYPGTFRVAESSEALHVLPSSARDNGGRIVSHQSLLDTRISIPFGERTAFEWANDVLSAVRQVTGAGLEFRSMPINLMLRSRLQGEAIYEPARDVLMRTLTGATGEKITWHFLYSPHEKKYSLGVFLVSEP